MNKFLKISVVALAAAAASGAHATLVWSSQNNGSSSAAFVAINDAATISLTVNLGATLSSFLALSGTQGVAAGLTSAAGALSAPGTIASWNLANNTYTINGVAQSGSNAWSAQTSSFFATAGSTYRWGVMAGDSAPGALSGTNSVGRQNLLFTNGVPVDFDNDVNTGTNAQGISDAAGTITNFYAESNVFGTHAAGVRGANTATSGGAFLGQSMMAGNVGTWGASSFGLNDALVAPGDTSFFTWGNQTNPSTIISIGQTYSTGSLASNPATFAWDAGSSTLTYTVPVPEPGTYALFLAGLAGVAFLVRRRRPE